MIIHQSLDPLVIYHANCSDGVAAHAATKNGTDVSVIAHLFGGGGHKHAAGFTSTSCVHQYFQPARRIKNNVP